MPEITNEELQKQLAELQKTVQTLEETILEHGQKHEEQEKVNKSVGAALKKVGTASAAKEEVAEAPKKKEPLVTPKTQIEVNGEKYVFTGPKAKDKNGAVVLTATIAESPDEYQEELQNWASTGSAILKKVKK